jgi:hypothetical protein
MKHEACDVRVVARNRHVDLEGIWTVEMHIDDIVLAALILVCRPQALVATGVTGT